MLERTKVEPRMMAAPNILEIFMDFLRWTLSIHRGVDAGSREAVHVLHARHMTQRQANAVAARSPTIQTDGSLRLSLRRQRVRNLQE